MSAINLLPLTLLLFGHYLADYLFQPRWFTRKKRQNIGYLFLHVLLVWFFLVMLFFPYRDQGVAAVLSVIAGLHLAIDWVKIKGRLKRRFGGRKRLNTVDQVIHLVIILIAWLLFFRNLSWPFAGAPPLLVLNILNAAVLFLIGGAALRHFRKKESREDELPRQMTAYSEKMPRVKEEN